MFRRIHFDTVPATDMERARDFYRDKLGFTIAFVHGDPAFYAQVKRIAALPKPERDAEMGKYRVAPEPTPVVAPATPASAASISG